MSRPPLPIRPGYWARAEDRQKVVNGLFNRSARHYDRTNDIMSFGSGRFYRRSALKRAGLQPGMNVLDVGTGTGLLAREALSILGSSGKVTGVDPSLAMMAAGEPGLVTRVQALGESLPFADGVFDFVTMGYALRHVADLDQTFDGYARVLKRGGRLVLLEITKPASPVGTALARTYFSQIVPWLTRIGTRSADAQQLMKFYWETIANCVPSDLILASLRRAGFMADRMVVAGIFSEYVGTRVK